MTRGELELAWAYNRTIYHGETPVRIQQLCSCWSKAETAIVVSVTNPKGQQRKCSFQELSAAIAKEPCTAIASTTELTTKEEQ